MENALPVPRTSRKRAAPKSVDQTENLPTRRTKRQHLVAIDESSDEEAEPAIKSTSKSAGIVTDSGKHTETLSKEMGSKGYGTSRSSAASRRSVVVRVDDTVGHEPFKNDVMIQVPSRYEQQALVADTSLEPVFTRTTFEPCPCTTP